MLTAYTKRLPDVPLIPYLYPNFGREERDAILFLNNAFKDIRDPFVTLTDDPAQADILLLAHNYSALRKHPEYVREFDALSRRTGKKVLVFWHGDRDAPVRLSNAIVFRTSLYRATKRANEIAMPAYAEDMLHGDSLVIRSKGDRPVVGFCGWADYKNVKNRIGTTVRNAILESGALLGRPQLRMRRKGISIRRDAVRILQTSDLVTTNFIIRSSYSGHSSTISIDPEIARREYRDNLLRCDLALCVKGDGNFSYRFYEALSLGRIPLLIDTDCVLPCEEHIDYDACMLKVPLARIHRLPEIVAEWWRTITPEDFIAMQEKARGVYEEHLSVPKFLLNIATVARCR